MPVEIIRGTTSKPVATEELIKIFRGAEGGSGQLIVGYPNLGGQQGEPEADAIWVSREYGTILFDLVEGTDPGDFASRQDDLYRLLNSRLLQSRDLVVRRKLVVTPQVVTFVPTLSHDAIIPGIDDDYLVGTADNLLNVIGENAEYANLDEDTYGRLVSAIQSISSIRRARRVRTVNDPSSRGAKLLQLESSISTLDSKQHHAVIETIEGVQRIRGLAGSGKTIILALKAAYLHGRNPEWKIGVTFYTRSLKDQIRQLITTFCIEQTGTEPDWDRINIVNAWGGRGGIDRTGIYKQFCDANSVTYYDYKSAKDQFAGDAFEGAVDQALTEAKSPEPVYDLLLVDEAQDFPPNFLRMCYQMLNEKHRMVYAYDELQSLTGNSLPDASEIFGKDSSGTPLVQFHESTYDQGARRDIILEKCYRNSRPVLVTAHALGFGIYRRPRSTRGNTSGLVQIFEHTGLWNEIGYHVSRGSLSDGEQVSLARSDATSPKFLEDHSPLDDLIQFHVFGTETEQNEWVAQQIQANLSRDELRSDDIIVINPNPFTARKNLGPLRKILLEANVNSHLAGVDVSADIFFNPGSDSVTFTGINRAKGNEAGMVYVVNAQEGNDSLADLAVVRNRLFTAITRSKAWVRVCGIGPEMEMLKAEFERVRSSFYELSFRYPTEAERGHLGIIHREITPEQRSQISNTETAVQAFLESVRKGKLYKEDLSGELLEHLRDIIGGDPGGN